MGVRVFWALTATLALLAFAACGNDSDDKQELTAVAEPAATPIPEPPAALTEIPPDAATGSTADAMALGPECLPDGAVTDPAVIIACSKAATLLQERFSFSGAFSFFGAIPIEGAQGGEGDTELSGVVVLPDRISLDITLRPDGQEINTSVILIGDDYYARLPDTDLWIKGSPDGEGSLGQVEMLSQLFLAQDIPTALQEVITLDDGRKAYMLFSKGMENADGVMTGDVTRVVTVDDFLTHEVRVAAQGLDGQTRDVVTVTFADYGASPDIEAPAGAMEIPAGAG